MVDVVCVMMDMVRCLIWWMWYGVCCDGTASLA